MGELIDFAERQKSRRKKKASSIPPIFRKFRVHAIRLLASIIKSGSYSVAYIVKKITGKLIKFYTILTIFIFVVEYIAGDIGYKSIYNAALLLILLTFINILASVYLNKLLRTKNEETLNTSDSRLVVCFIFLPAMLKIPAKLLCAWRASSPAIAAEASVTVLKLLSSISLKRTSTAFYPTTRRMLGRLFLMNARIMAKVEVTSR